MKRLLALSLLVLLLMPFTGCDPLYFTIKFRNTVTTDIDIRGIYMAPAGGTYGQNLLPVGMLHPGEYFILEQLDRWSDYDVKVVFDVLDPENGTNYQRELKGNVPVAPPEDCVSWSASASVSSGRPYGGLGYFWGCTDEDFTDYDLVGE